MSAKKTPSLELLWRSSPFSCTKLSFAAAPPQNMNGVDQDGAKWAEEQLIDALETATSQLTICREAGSPVPGYAALTSFLLE